MSNIPIDTEDIEVPPLPSSEEEQKKNSDPVDPVKKRGKGVNQTEVFALQKSINGPPNPMSFRNLSLPSYEK